MNEIFATIEAGFMKRILFLKRSWIGEKISLLK